MIKLKDLFRETLIKSEDSPGKILLGKEIISSTSDGYYHGSHVNNLTKETVNLFSKGSDIGNTGVGDRYGFYITPFLSKAYDYSSIWIETGDSSQKLQREGKSIIDNMREKSLKSEGEIVEENIYGPPFSLVEDFGKKMGLEGYELYRLRTGDLEYWDFFSILAAVKRGFWPSIYKVDLNPQDKFLAKLDLHINKEEFDEYSKDNVVGVYNGKLVKNSDSREEIAILNRDAIASMDKVDDSTYFEGMKKYWKDKNFGELSNEKWNFAKKLLTKYNKF